MRNPGGYLIHQGDGTDIEHDTFTCAHCNLVVTVPNKNEGTMPGGFCQLCNKLVCDYCSTRGCTPFEKKMDEMERRDRLMRAVGV